MTIYIMFSIFIIYLLIFSVNMTFKKNMDDFNFTTYNTNYLKGFWSIIIILVHTPLVHQNKIQDMIGSFAYIGVTFFFLSSSFGLLYSVANKKDYLKSFWKNRLLKLLIPCILINLFVIFLKLLFKENVYIFDFININKWVLLLLLCYFVFFLLNMIFKKNKKIVLLLTTITIMLMSLIDYFTDINLTLLWKTEIFGFVWGILLYTYLNNEKLKIKHNKILFTSILFLITLFLGLLYLKFKKIYFIGDYIIKILLGLAFNIFILSLIQFIKLGNKITEFLGKISYETFLIHGVIFKYLDKFIIINNSAIYITIVILLSIIFSSIVYYLSKKLLELF